MNTKRPILLILLFTLCGATLARAEPESQPWSGDEPALSLCHTGKWSRACLLGLLTYRCTQYTAPLPPTGCALASAKFVDLLEMKRIDVEVNGTIYNLPVIFTNRLERLIQDHTTQLGLYNLRNHLNQGKEIRRGFDLWKWSLEMRIGNSERTLENLAVLLQDTSAIAIQVKYLQAIAKLKTFSARTIQAIDDLDEITYRLNHEILTEEKSLGWLKLYPAIGRIETDATPLIYHFYPMAYLARLLRNAGMGDRLSSFLPFLFNTEYLSQTLDVEAWPFHHPKPFPIDDDQIRWTMRDAYAGLAGGVFGVRPNAKLPTLQKFQTNYARDPFRTMRALFWSMPNIP